MFNLKLLYLIAGIIIFDQPFIFDSGKGKIIFNNKKQFEILSLVKSINDKASLADTGQCREWTMSKADIKKVIKDSRNITGTEWDLSFLALSCIIKGTLRQNGFLFNYELNAGSWIYISSPDTTIILADFIKKDEKYFLEKPSKE